jgi:hypothetical protein
LPPSRGNIRTESIEKQFNQALDQLIEQVREDRSILAAVLCGSLSHDTVWEKSDIDLVLVTVDDKKAESSSLALNADGVNVHASLMPRALFRKAAEGSIRNSFVHSLLAKGRLLYTHDETLAHLFARLREIGERDTELQLFAAAASALPPLYKARKWILTRGDLDYTALFILHTATPLARVEVIGARLLADREVIPQALKLNPVLFQKIYTEMLNGKKTQKNVQGALDAINQYLSKRASKLFRPVLDHLSEVGEARSATEIEDYFKRNFNLPGVTIACEYLADEGLIEKVSIPVQLTRKSNVMVQELAFVHI